MQTDPRPEIPKFCWRHQARSKVLICCLLLHQAPSHAKAQSAMLLEPSAGRVMEGPKEDTRKPDRPFNSRNSEPELPAQQSTLERSPMPLHRPHWLPWVMSSAPRECPSPPVALAMSFEVWAASVLPPITSFWAQLFHYFAVQLTAHLGSPHFLSFSRST